MTTKHYIQTGDVVSFDVSYETDSFYAIGTGHFIDKFKCGDTVDEAWIIYASNLLSSIREKEIEILKLKALYKNAIEKLREWINGQHAD